MRKALIVGINAYPGCPLQGCVNDAVNMRNLLMTRYGFGSGDICMLTDGEATTANILSKLDWLVDVRPGDFVVFHYSGHGAQVPTGDPSEPDGLSECICPVDFDWSAPRMIIDKQFVSIFSRIPAGCIFNWASDSCHSGDLDRELVAPVAMSKSNVFYPIACFLKKLCFWQKPKVATAKTFPNPPHIMLGISRAAAKGFQTRGMVGGKLDVGFISGCKSNQTSADTYMNNQPCGALTTFLIKNINETPNVPLSTLVANINRDLQANGYSQSPQAEGARVNKAFLVA